MFLMFLLCVLNWSCSSFVPPLSLVVLSLSWVCSVGGHTVLYFSYLLLLLAEREERAVTFRREREVLCFLIISSVEVSPSVIPLERWVYVLVVVTRVTMNMGQ